MAFTLFQRHLGGIRPHPHAHHIGLTAAMLGLIGIPLGPILIFSVLAIVLGAVAVGLSLRPAPGMDAKPEGFVAIATGLMGLLFGGAQLALQTFWTGW